MLTTKIEKKYEHAVVSACCENNCKLQIGAEGEYIILKGEKLVTQGKICDCIIFRNDGTTVMAELKSSSLAVSSIVEQLTNGGKKAVEIAGKSGVSEHSLYFILMAKSFKNYSAKYRLNHQKVRIGEKRYPIRRSKCNSTRTMNSILNLQH